MRVAHDAAVFVLAEDLGQPDRRHDLAADQRGEDVARADGWELVRVADHDQPRVGRERPEQGVHQRQIDHGALIEDDRVAVELVLFALGKDDMVPLLVELRAEEAMDRRRLLARQFGHALGGPSRGRAEEALEAQCVE